MQRGKRSYNQKQLIITTTRKNTCGDCMPSPENAPFLVASEFKTGTSTKNEKKKKETNKDKHRKKHTSKQRVIQATEPEYTWWKNDSTRNSNKQNQRECNETNS